MMASGWLFAGTIKAMGAIIAAPRIPNLMGVIVVVRGTVGGLNICRYKTYNVKIAPWNKICTLHMLAGILQGGIII